MRQIHVRRHLFRGFGIFERDRSAQADRVAKLDEFPGHFPAGAETMDDPAAGSGMLAQKGQRIADRVAAVDQNRFVDPVRQLDLNAACC